MTIELQGYTPVVDGKIYTRTDMADVTIVSAGSPREEKIGIRRILLLGRYHQPTENDVVDYLKEKAGEPAISTRLALPKGVSIGEDKTPLEQLLLKLPEQVLGHLRTGKEDLLNLLKGSTTAPRDDSDRAHASYARVRYGIISEKLMEKHKEALEDSPDKFYEAVLGHDGLREMGFGERWAAGIRLLSSDGKSTLPLKADIEVLLKHGTSISDTLTIDRRSYSKEEVGGVLDALYGGLSTDECINLLPDISQEVREMHAIEAVVGLHKYLERQVTEEVMKERRRNSGRPNV